MSPGRALFLVVMYCVFAIVVSVVIYAFFIDVNPPYIPKTVLVRNMAGEQTTHFKRGDTMLVERENCGREEVVLFFSRKLIRVSDGFTYNLQGAPYLVEKGCVTTINAPQIPVYTKPGRYRYSVVAPYQNNLLHSGLVALKTFEIDIE